MSGALWELKKKAKKKKRSVGWEHIHTPMFMLAFHLSGQTAHTVQCTQAWAWSVWESVSCITTMAGFCVALLWAVGDRGVNEWRGFMDASVQGHEGVGGWLSQQQADAEPIQSACREAHMVNKSNRWNEATQPVTRLSQGGWLIQLYSSLKSHIRQWENKKIIVNS